MTYLAASGLVIVNTVWLALVLLGVPGNWLMVVTTALVSWWRWDSSLPAGDQMIGIPVLVGVLLLAIVGEALEFAAGMVGARRAGGGGWGVVGALLGGLLGALAGTLVIPVPVLGTLIGACLGAAVGGALLELAGGKPAARSVRIGFGAGVGYLLGTTGKLLIGGIIWMIVAVAAFWP